MRPYFSQLLTPAALAPRSTVRGKNAGQAPVPERRRNGSVRRRASAFLILPLKLKVTNPLVIPCYCRGYLRPC
jgi:hypothetical protein